MKLLYIGSRDFLAESLIEKFRKEDYEISFLSEKKFSGKKDYKMENRFYNYSTNIDTLETIISSVKPDVFVFAGLNYLDYLWNEENEDYLTILRYALELSQKYKVGKFIYLSSVEVFGTINQEVTEEYSISPETRKGIIMAQGEYLVELYRSKYGMHASTVRSSYVYSKTCNNESKDFLSTMFQNADLNEKGLTDISNKYQPVFVEDFVEAIKRITEYGRSTTYQIASTKEIKEPLINCNKIKEELEWVDFYSLTSMLENNEIIYSKSKRSEKKKRKKTSVPIRRTIENVFIFAVFFILYLISNEHPLFSKIQWLLIYVMIISIFYGVRQSLFSILLASAGYLYVTNLNIFEMANFYSYAEAAIVIVSFVFFGTVISYQFDMMREKSREIKKNHDLLSDELNELKEINMENVRVKEEYEKRILNSKSGITKVYDIVNRLMVLQPERIFVELMQVIREFLDTDKISVYKTNKNSPYFRLINALNANSVIEGKSWNIEKFPKIQDAIENGEIFQGDVWKNEPAFVIPINHHGELIAVVVVKEVSFEKQSLYYLNVLRTLRMLIVDSVIKAVDYERINRADRYEEATDVLKWNSFLEILKIAEEKKLKGVADYSVLKIENPKESNIIDELSSMLRITDFIGSDTEGVLYTLLSNSNENDSINVISRMREKGINAHIVNELKGV